MGGCPVHCRKLSSLPGFYPLHANSTLSQMWQPKTSLDMTNVSWGAVSACLGTTSLDMQLTRTSQGMLASMKGPRVGQHHVYRSASLLAEWILLRHSALKTARGLLPLILCPEEPPANHGHFPQLLDKAPFGKAAADQHKFCWGKSGQYQQPCQVVLPFNLHVSTDGSHPTPRFPLKNSLGQSTAGWINEGSIFSQWNATATIMCGSPPHASVWANLPDTVLSERSQERESPCCMHPLMKSSPKGTFYLFKVQGGHNGGFGMWVKGVKIH